MSNNSQITRTISVQANTQQANQQLSSTDVLLQQLIQSNLTLNQTLAANATAQNTTATATQTAATATASSVRATTAATTATNGHTQSVTENGGAMGILNMLTAGYAQVVKDAIEASALFTQSTRLSTLVQTIYTRVTGQATAATTAFKVALAATGIGLVLVLIAGLVAAYDALTISSEEAKESQDAYNESMKRFSDGIKDNIEQINRRAALDAETSRARGESIDVIRAKEKQASDERIAQYRSELTEMNNADLPLFADEEGRDAYFKKFFEDIKRINSDIEKEQFEQRLRESKNIADDAEKARAALEKARDEAAKKKEAKDNEAKKALEDYNKKILELNKKLIDDIENLQDDDDRKKLERAETREINALDEFVKARDRQEALYKIAVKYQLLFANLDAEEKKKADEAAEEQRKKDQEVAEARAQRALSDIDYQLSQDDKNLEARRKTLDEEQALLEEFKEKGLITEDEYTDGIRKNAESRKEIGRLEKEARAEQLNQLNSLFANAAKLLGEHTAAGKALAIASTTISTFQSAQQSYAGMVEAIPGPIGIALGAVAAGVAVASGLANVKKILSVKVPGGGGGGAGASAAASAPSGPRFNVVGTSTQSQLSQTIANQQQQPIQAYVVAGAVTTQQSLDRNIVNNATFG